MQPEISKPLLFLLMAKEIQNAVICKYHKVDMKAQVYDLNNQIYSLKCRLLSVTEHYNMLEGLWLELDPADDVQVQKKMIEQNRVLAFLVDFKDISPPPPYQTLV